MGADSSKYAIDFIKEENDKISVDTFVQGDGVLVDVRFHKEIYQPGCIEFKIDLGTATDVDKYKGLV
ncbi:MAG: hypothetical protein Q4A54_12370, partial [Parabacteroides sp.]|nr:hypothetical protein [Parabacteroides sp.]